MPQSHNGWRSLRFFCVCKSLSIPCQEELDEISAWDAAGKIRHLAKEILHLTKLKAEPSDVVLGRRVVELFDVMHDQAQGTWCREKLLKHGCRGCH